MWWGKGLLSIFSLLYLNLNMSEKNVTFYNSFSFLSFLRRWFIHRESITALNIYWRIHSSTWKNFYRKASSLIHSNSVFPPQFYTLWDEVLSEWCKRYRFIAWKSKNSPNSFTTFTGPVTSLQGTPRTAAVGAAVLYPRQDSLTDPETLRTSLNS